MSRCMYVKFRWSCGEFLCMQRVHLRCVVSDNADLLWDVFSTAPYLFYWSQPQPSPRRQPAVCPAITKTGPRVVNPWPPAARHGLVRGEVGGMTPTWGLEARDTLDSCLRYSWCSVVFACVYHALSLIKKHNNKKLKEMQAGVILGGATKLCSEENDLYLSERRFCAQIQGRAN